MNILIRNASSFIDKNYFVNEHPVKLIHIVIVCATGVRSHGVSMGIRMCFALDLKDDPKLIAQYRKWHEPGGPPPAVTQSLRDAGIEALEIYLCGNRLFMLLEADESFSIEKKARADAANDAVCAWEELMWNFQQRLPWARADEKWVLAERIYDIDSQS